ncbi:UNVERIFIED_CONTAM: hypothetical protein NCL1_38749 [Trichonephila clavipes]
MLSTGPLPWQVVAVVNKSWSRGGTKPSRRPWLHVQKIVKSQIHSRKGFFTPLVEEWYQIVSY